MRLCGGLFPYFFAVVYEMDVIVVTVCLLWFSCAFFSVSNLVFGDRFLTIFVPCLLR